MNHGRLRYLEAKRTVDERALNESVRRRLLAAVPPDPRVFEAGCGTGATVPRLLDWGVRPGSYVGVDTDEAVLECARELRPAELRRRGHGAVDTPRGFRLAGRPFEFRSDDAVRFVEEQADPVDLLVAGAFMDLVPLANAVPAFEGVLDDGGLAYFPITFDGATVFQPDHPADEAVTSAYHEFIDATDGRDVRAGRHLAVRLQAGEGNLLAMGASDWVVRARDGSYPADERHFLATILEFVERALGTVDVDGGDEWLATRRDQLAGGELIYVAHQYDLLYRAPG